MRKLIFYLVALVLVAGAAVVIIIAVRSSKSHDDNTSNTTAAVNTQKSKKACDIFTLADAKLLLGSNAKGGPDPTIDSSQNFNVSACMYTQDQGANAPVTGAQTATLLVQAPKTQQGVNTNQNEFGPLKPQGMQDIGGYGDKAYWDQPHGQLNILKNNTWYILSYGSVSPADRSLDMAKKMADILIKKM